MSGAGSRTPRGRKPRAHWGQPVLSERRPKNYHRQMLVQPPLPYTRPLLLPFGLLGFRSPLRPPLLVGWGTHGDQKSTFSSVCTAGHLLRLTAGSVLSVVRDVISQQNRSYASACSSIIFSSSTVFASFLSFLHPAQKDSIETSL